MNNIEFYLGYSFKNRENYCIIRSVGISGQYDGVDFTSSLRPSSFKGMSYTRCKKLKVKRIL